MKCETCQQTIAPAIERVKGVTKVDVNLPDKVQTVELMPGEASLKQIELAISNADCDANELKKSSEACENLPSCCK